MSEGQTEGNKELRVKLGRLLCQLGKLGLVTPGRQTCNLFEVSLNQLDRSAESANCDRLFRCFLGISLY